MAPLSLPVKPAHDAESVVHTIGTLRGVKHSNLNPPARAD